MKNQKIAGPENIEHKKNDNLFIVGFAKILFTMLFLVICVWMLWISYSVLAEAIKTYVLKVV